MGALASEDLPLPSSLLPTQLFTGTQGLCMCRPLKTKQPQKIRLKKSVKTSVLCLDYFTIQPVEGNEEPQ